MRRVSPASGPRRAAVQAACGCFLTWLISSTALGQAAPLGRYFPREDLVAYVEFDGLDAHPGAWRQTATYKVLNETPTGAMLEKVVSQVLNGVTASEPREKISGTDVVTVITHAFRAGFAFGINRKGGSEKPSCVGFVLRGAARGEVRAIVGRLIDAGNTPEMKAESVARSGGRQVMTVADKQGRGFAWWTEKDDLVFSLVTPKGADAMIAALDGDRPNAVGHPTRTELARADAGFTPIGLAYFDMAALPKLPPRAASFGLDRIQRFDYRWGFDGEALVTVSRIVAPAPRAGVLALLDQPTFSARDLPPVPSGLAGFTVFSIQPGRFFDRVVALTKATDPSASMQLGQLAQQVQAATGHDLRKDLLGHLGPRMVTYSVPEKINAPTNALEGLARGLVHVAQTVLVVEVDDAEEFGKVLDDVVKRSKGALAALANSQGPVPEFEAVKGKEHGYILSLPPSVVPMPAGMRPTVLVGKKIVVFGTTLGAARRALALEGRPGGLAGADPLATVLKHLPGNLTLLNVDDTRSSMLADIVANLPGLVQLVASSQQAGGPNQTLNQLFRFSFPAPASVMPGNSGFQLKMDPDDIPTPDDIRPYLFPSTFAMTSDDQGLRFLSRESFPALSPTTVAPIAVALLLPAVQASRAAALRAQSTNNLKQIGLALHNYHSANNTFPPVATRDKKGKPLLSWRVAILPYIEQAELFNEFKLDEPWDSEHNKALLERMPPTYAVPGARAEPGHTFYRVFSGKGTVFDPSVKDGLTLEQIKDGTSNTITDPPVKGGVTITQITDGTSNTIAVIEAKEAVPWTKPDGEIPFDLNPAKPDPDAIQALIGQLGNHFPGGFNALLTDGSVRFIKSSVSAVVLQALITRAGGEVISADSF